MHDLQVRDDRVVHVLPEQRRGVQRVQVNSIRDFDQVELLFFRQDFVDVRFEEGVGFEDFGADAALGGGFDFGFLAWGESGGGDSLGV